MLRLRSFALFTGLLLAAVAAGTAPAHAVVVSAGSGSGLAGQTVNIDINTTSLTGLNVRSLQFEVRYNSTVVTATGVVMTGSLTGAAGWQPASFSVDAPSANVGRIRVSTAGTTALTGAGSLLKLSFAIDPSLLNGGSTTLTLSNLTFNEGSPNDTTANGTLTVNVTPQINVSPDVGEIVRGQTLAFTVTGSVTNPVTWSTSDNAVATISAAGLLTGVAPGAVQVTALDAAAHSNTTTGQILIRGMGLTTGNATMFLGQTVQVPITVTSLAQLGIRSGQFKMSWTGSGFATATGVTTPPGTLLNGWGPLSFDADPGSCTVSFAGSTDLTGTGVLCYVTFAASPTLSGSSALTLSNAVFNETLPAKTTNGTISVSPLPTITVTPDQVTLLAGQTQQMTVGGSPTPPVTWSTLDPTIASISASGLLTAVKGGVTKVKAVDNVGATDLNLLVRVYDLQATLGTVTVRPGTTVRVALTSDRLVGGLAVRSLQCKVSWSGTAIAAARAVPSALWLEWGTGWSPYTTPTSITVAHAGTLPLDNAGPDLAAFEFDIAPGAVAPQDVPLTVSALVLNEGDPSPVTVNGVLHIRATAAVEGGAGFVFALGAASPNPVSGPARIPFSLPAGASANERVTLAVYGLDGRLVRTLVDGTLEPGPHEAAWDARDEHARQVRAGIYFARLTLHGVALARKLTVVH